MEKEELILIAEDSPTTRSMKPPCEKPTKTVTRIQYEVLTENPYKYTEREFYREVYEVRLHKYDRKLDSFMIKRSELAKKYGWGFHRNSHNKLALVGCDFEKYQQLLKDRSVKKIKSFRNKKK